MKLFKEDIILVTYVWPCGDKLSFKRSSFILSLYLYAVHDNNAIKLSFSCQHMRAHVVVVTY